MDRSSLKEKITSDQRLKQAILRFVMHPQKARPNWWIRLFMNCYIKRGKKTVLYRNARLDLTPFNRFSIGDYSVIESFSTVNNAMGDLTIGCHSRVGMGNTIIAPVRIGNHVHLAQNIVVTALNHNFEEVSRLIDEQGVNVSPVTIEDDAWIGANSTLLPGVTIGHHSIVGAGSVVTRSIPPYSVAVGNPAKIIKQYDFISGKWTKISL